MGLKNFHLLFIVASVLMSLGFGMWCFFTEQGLALAGSKPVGALCFLTGVGLVVYAVSFMRKLRREGIK